MNRDIRKDPLYREAEILYRNLRQPGTGQISDAAEVHASPDGNRGVFSGSIVDKLEGTAPTRICQAEIPSGNTRVLTFGPNTDRSPKYSPDGQQVAFLSDRQKVGDFQLYLLDPISGAARPTAAVKGWVEYLHWSPDGRRILLGVAGHGADIAGGQGAITSKSLVAELPSWAPAVESGDESYHWRRTWIYELATDRVSQVGNAEINVWEAVWSGNEAIAAVVSAGPGEGLWYSAWLALIDIDTGNSRKLYKSHYQLGWPACVTSGKHVAIVEAICSDRWIVAGNVLVIDTYSGDVQRPDTRGVDVTYTEWRSDRHLLIAGHRGFETVVGVYDSSSGIYTETWRGREITTGGLYAAVSGFNDAGDCILVGENFMRAPELGVVRQGEYKSVRSFDLGYGEQAKVIDTVERVNWGAPDGLGIQGWLLRPKGYGPFPLVMVIHGGPVSHWRPTCLGRKHVPLLMLLKRGYAIFFPNPRGSSGRGQDYIRHVWGDVGGVDTYDYLSGLDHLVLMGIADPRRLGVTGVSYGGFMTSWLITQDSRFAAAVSVAPVTNQVTAHLISNIPHFVDLSLADTYTNPDGKYFQRSPIMHAYKVKTPTLNVCGTLDRCTPPEEAVQFHNALLENGVRSVLITYPEEGHGIRSFPAVIDYAARAVAWFEENMPATN